MAYSRSDIFNLVMLVKIGLLMFAIFGWLSTAGYSLGAGLLIVMILYQPVLFWKKMSRQPLFWLSLLAIGFLLIHWLITTPIDQQAAEYAKKYTQGLIYLWLFTIIGWHLCSHEELTRWMIGLASLGLVIKVLMETDWQHLNLFFSQRQDFGFSWTGVGLHSALSVWGLLLIGFFIFRTYSGFKRWIVVLMILMGMLVLVEALTLSGSRGAWISILVATFITVLLLFIKEGKAVRSISNLQWIAIGLMLVFLLSSFLILNHKLLSARVGGDSHVYGTLLSLDREQIPYTPLGARAHMLLYGVELWQDKPLLGWGVGSSRSLLAKDEMMKGNDHPHFHNNYLELLVEQGVVGFSFYLLAFTLLMYGLFKAYSERVVAKDLFYYLIGAWVMVLVWSLADSRMVHADLRFLFLLLSGITFSIILNRDRETISF